MASEPSLKLDHFGYRSDARLNSVTDVTAYVRVAVSEARHAYDLVHVECGGGALRQFYAAWAI